MKPIVTIGIIILGLIFSVNAFAADVVQGECIEFNSETKIIKVREYDTNKTPENKNYGNPTTIESEFDVSKAKMGANPEIGDIVRIAYIVEGNRNIAIKVMDVTKQDLMKK